MILHLNHICQNVPVTTAEFASKMVLKYLNNSLDMIDTNFLVQDNRKKELLDKYEIDKICCRMRLLTYIKLIDIVSIRKR